jgi:hypothetical protein
MPARCPECRGTGYLFNPRTNHGAACERCDGTGKVSAAKDIPAAIRAKVRERSGGMCEVCHVRPATDQHHRQFRSRGGEHIVENLVDICGPGNAFGCHADAHGPKPPEGLAVSSWATQPLDEIPFTDKFGISWLLMADGTKEGKATPCQDFSMAGRRRSERNDQ